MGGWDDENSLTVGISLGMCPTNERRYIVPLHINLIVIRALQGTVSDLEKRLGNGVKTVTHVHDVHQAVLEVLIGQT